MAVAGFVCWVEKADLAAAVLLLVVDLCRRTALWPICVGSRPRECGWRCWLFGFCPVYSCRWPVDLWTAGSRCCFAVAVGRLLREKKALLMAERSAAEMEKVWC